MLRRMQGLRMRLTTSLQAFRGVFRNPNLRRIQLAWAGSISGDWAYVIALSVFAYERGGATAVGLVALIRWAPAAVAAPFMSVFGDRHRRERVMVAVDLTRAIALGVAAAVVFLDGPAGIVYALAGLVQVVATGFRPAQAALLPLLATEPEELTAANVVSSSVESVGSFAGPALGGLILALTSPGAVFVFTAAMFLWSALNVLGIRTPAQPEREPVEEHVVSELLGGFRTVARERNVRLVIGLFSAQTLVSGALTVLVVATAFRLLDIGKSGVGFLNAASGVGGVIGAVAAMALVGRRRLGVDFGLGLVFWGVPIALIGVWPHEASALVLLALVGIGNTLVDVAGLTLLQRTVRDDVLARVFGVLESLFFASGAVGAILAPALIGAAGVRAALIVTGCVLPALTLLAWRGLARLDVGVAVPERQLGLLEAIPIFAPLTAASLEQLAARLQPVRFPAGATVFRQGDRGDRFYVVDAGEVEIVVDEREPLVHGPGSYFGEIALLRDVARTATVRARTDVELLALERDDFIAAVTGHALSSRAADTVIGERLGALRPEAASI